MVIGDGPRASRPGEAAAVSATRAEIELIDWPCDVRTHYSDVNLGCGRRVSSGLQWVFEQCESAIILEDDCVPNPSFFPFCEALLERYADDQRGMHIAGASFLASPPADGSSYHFSNSTHVWGWASWRRAWTHYQFAMTAWPTWKQTSLPSSVPDPRVRRSVTGLYDKVYAGLVDTWDVQWEFACRLNGGLGIVPSVNLVSNIGFGIGATHTHDPLHPAAKLPAASLPFPLLHPAMIVADAEADAETARLFRPSALQRIRSAVTRMFAPVLGRDFGSHSSTGAR